MEPYAPEPPAPPGAEQQEGHAVPILAAYPGEEHQPHEQQLQHEEEGTPGGAGGHDASALEGLAGHLLSSGGGGGGRGSSGGGGSYKRVGPSFCQVVGCGKPLEGLKEYHQVCEREKGGRKGGRGRGRGAGQGLGRRRASCAGAAAAGWGAAGPRASTAPTR